jgi:hypothetical protein
LACDHACRANLGASQNFGEQIGRPCFAPRGRKNLNYGPKYWRGIDGRVSIQTLEYTGSQRQNFGVVTVGPNPNRLLIQVDHAPWCTYKPKEQFSHLIQLVHKSYLMSMQFQRSWCSVQLSHVAVMSSASNLQTVEKKVSIYHSHKS